MFWHNPFDRFLFFRIAQIRPPIRHRGIAAAEISQKGLGKYRILWYSEQMDEEEKCLRDI